MLASMQGPPARVIAHLDCDAFFATVELLRRPELRGLPVIVAGNGPRSVVTTATYEARRFGIGSGMPASRALRLCPDAVVVPPDADAYRQTSRAVWDRTAEHVAILQRAGIDEAYADLTGVAKPVAVLRRLVADVREHTGVQLSVGVGPSRLVAKCCSDVGKPAGFVAMSRQEACRRFAQAPARRLPGIGPKSADRLAALGIVTIADLQSAPTTLLETHFGARWGRELHTRAHFHDDSPVVAQAPPPKSMSSERTFDHDIADAGELAQALAVLGTRVTEAMVTKGRRARTVAIKVRLSDWTTVTRARTLPDPVDDAAVVREVAHALLRDYQPRLPVRLLGVRLAGFDDVDAPAPTLPRERRQLRLPVDHPA